MSTFRRLIRASLLVLFALPASAQRRVHDNRLQSDSLPSAVLSFDTSLKYLGTQSFVLYNVANAEQHFFAELDGKRVKRFVWIQFEGYLPSSAEKYDYSADSIITLWGQPIHHAGSLRETPVREQRPESDGARARQFLRERGLTLGPSMLYHRLVWIVDEKARNELMIIYMEDPEIHGISAQSLAGAGGSSRLAGLLRLSLATAEGSIRIDKR